MMRMKRILQSVRFRLSLFAGRLSPLHIIPFSFFAAILAGTLLLLLPWASSPGSSTDFLTACFTATTSVCVTGLVVVDTYAHWSLFGQVVLLFLIQIGGLGIISAIALLMMVFHRKISLKNRTILRDALNLDSVSGTLRFLLGVFRGTLLVEGVGALFYAFSFVPACGWRKGLWYSVFHAVSAFCNAGIDILGPDSLMGYASDWYFLSVTMLLIITGGLGYVVWFDVRSTMKKSLRHRFSLRQMLTRLSEHSKLVLGMTLFLILGGAVFIFFAERTNPGTLGGKSFPDQLLGSLFQSVTFRTAGFAAMPQDKLTGVSCLAGYLLMFIGGSPIGTAGGVKTVTFFLVLLNAASYISDRNSAVVFRHSVPGELMRKAAAIVLVSFFSMLLLTLLLMSVSSVSMEDGLFEICSAIATVGLTRGLTPNLSTGGKWIVIIAMYLGRIGPISMALFFSRMRQENNLIHFGEGRFYVG